MKKLLLILLLPACGPEIEVMPLNQDQLFCLKGTRNGVTEVIDCQANWGDNPDFSEWTNKEWKKVNSCEDCY